MTIAILIIEGQRLGHLGEARQFALLEADPSNRTVFRSQVVEVLPHKPGSFPRWLNEQGVHMVIVAGIGQRALDNLKHRGIEVRAGQAGARVESLVDCLGRAVHRDARWLRSSAQRSGRA